MMRRIAAAVIAFIFAGIGMSAQNNSGHFNADSMVFIPANVLDSTLVGRNIVDMLGSEVNQSPQIREGLNLRIERNASRKMTGYRVRIFFDNKQNARQESETAMKTFIESFPGYAAYRSFANPFFKVTVGDFRTRSEAAGMLQRLKEFYPAAILVKETINYPAVVGNNPELEL